MLREAGLTGRMVAMDFVARRIAPLQWHSEPMWTYSGPDDRMRLSADDLTPSELKQIMKVLFATESVSPPSDDDALPLFTFLDENVREARELLPLFDEWGIRPARLVGSRSNPWAAEKEQGGGAPEPDEDEESGEEEASGSANSSGED